jgi:fructose-specific phosphotransferase system component IIB
MDTPFAEDEGSVEVDERLVDDMIRVAKAVLMALDTAMEQH